jgi:hypothetical protein
MVKVEEFILPGIPMLKEIGEELKQKLKMIKTLKVGLSEQSERMPHIAPSWRKNCWRRTKTKA